MTRMILGLAWLLRICWLISLALGLALWFGHGYQFLKLHMWVGFVITFDLLLLAIAGLLARLPPVLPLLTILWAIGLPVIGIGQLRAMPGANHWIIQVIHLLFGLGAVGLGEVLSKRAQLRSRAV
jgi:hypothetical protein